MYHSCSVEYRDSQRWALYKGQTGTEGHKSLETGNHSLEPSWGIALGTKAKARRVGSGMACNDGPDRLLGLFCGRAELAWLHWRDLRMLSLFFELFCLLSWGSATQDSHLPTDLETEGTCCWSPREEVDMPEFILSSYARSSYVISEVQKSTSHT